MDVRTEIAVIEAALRDRRVSVARLCRTADLAQTTWVRWKNGAPAQQRSWARITSAMAEIAPGLDVPQPAEAA